MDAPTLPEQGPAAELLEPGALAAELLAGFGSIRRSGRLAGRPAELSALTGAQLELVRLLRRRPGISVARAAAELRLAPNTISTLVRQLTEAGLVVRRADSADRRIAHLDLTPDTRRDVDRFRDRRIALLASAIAELPSDDRLRLCEAAGVLARIAERLPELLGRV